MYLAGGGGRGVGESRSHPAQHPKSTRGTKRERRSFAQKKRIILFGLGREGAQTSNGEKDEISVFVASPTIPPFFGRMVPCNRRVPNGNRKIYFTRRPYFLRAARKLCGRSHALEGGIVMRENPHLSFAINSINIHFSYRIKSINNHFSYRTYISYFSSLPVSRSPASVFFASTSVLP